MKRWRLLRPHVEEDVPLSQIAAGSGTPERTLRRWRAGYWASGLAALARRRIPVARSRKSPHM
ncbi:helix-turn-helix domain-containing protein [Nonomuraea sp. NPDC050643]|uniref:helix-turn-helix domain-containing protein n=1 Tax=Nonomuraea sp. NPDC050643 TaxID=3155660 RepID=UPI0033E4B532